MWDLIVSVPYHCLSFYFLKSFTQQMDSFQNEVRIETGFDITKTLTVSH